MDVDVKQITCKTCKNKFEPLYRNGILLSKLCIKCLVEKKRKIDRLKWKNEKKTIKEKLKTHSQWLNDLQKIFNKYIRLRDKNKPCISCNKPLTGKYDAGHFFSVGAYPNLRFNEDNVHGQCVECNQHKHGNITEYSINIHKRIGLERSNNLLEMRKEPLKLSTEEIKDKMKYYKHLIKILDG